MQRIILAGFKGCGKNTVGEYLVSHYGYTGISFADALKDSVAAICCWPRDLLEGNTPEARTWRETVDPWWEEKLGIPGFTPRWMLQNFGTEVMRKHFNANIWISNVEKRIHDLGDRPVVVFDGRFPNEIELVTKTFSGLSIRVRRGDEPSWYESARRANNGVEQDKTYMEVIGIHESERAWIGHPFDYVLGNDSTVTALHRQVDELMK